MLNLLAFTCLTLTLIPSQFFTSALKLKCPLEWRATALGELPANSIAASTSLTGTPDYIGRVDERSSSSPGDLFNVGSIDTTSGLLFVVDGDGVALNFSEYQILTNPFACILSWDLVPDGGYTVGSVGRGPVGSLNRIKSGHVYGNELHVNDNGVVTKLTSLNFEYLTSYLNGLKRKTIDMEVLMDETIEPNCEVMALDEIENKSPSTVTQVLTHRSRMLESQTLTSWSSWSSTTEFSFGVSLSFEIPLDAVGCVGCKAGVDLGFNFDISVTEGEKETRSIYRATEKEITLVRNITVAPYTSVEACSIVVKIDDFEAIYKALDIYNAPGLSLDEVNSILIEGGITNGYPHEDGHSIAVPVEGDIGADIFVTTRFYIFPLIEGSDNICTQVSKRNAAAIGRKKRISNGNKIKVKATNLNNWPRRIVYA